MVRIYWSHYHRSSHLPSHLVEGGERYNGEPYYICRALVEDELCIGKFYPHRRIARVPYGGKEYTFRSCDLLVCDKPQMLQWVRMEGGKTPFGAIAGGCTKGGNVLFVGRAREDNELVPGKIYPQHHRIYVSDDGKEVSHYHYEALAMRHVVPPRRHHNHHHGHHHNHHEHYDYDD